MRLPKCDELARNRCRDRVRSSGRMPQCCQPTGMRTAADIVRPQPDCGAGALLQRGGGHRQGRGRLPRRAAGCRDLRLRQQFHRPHRRGRGRGRRHRPARAAPGQGPRGAAHVRRRRRRHLRAGRRRRDLRRAERAGDDRAAGGRAARHGLAVARRPRGGGLPARPSRRQPAADRLRRACVRPVLHRHAVGLPGVLAALREVVSGAVRRLRDRDRADRACARARIAGRRDADAVLFAAGRLGLQAQHLARRLPHPADDPAALSRGAAAAAVHRPRHFARRSSRSGSRSRSSSPICRKASCRGCRPRCCRPA